MTGLIAMLTLAGATLRRHFSHRPVMALIGAGPGPIARDQVEEQADWENEGGAV